MQATIDIDPQLLREASQLAHRNGQPLSTFLEQALGDSLRNSQTQPPATELYGEPLTDEDIAEIARVAFQRLDEEEMGA